MKKISDQEIATYFSKRVEFRLDQELQNGLQILEKERARAAKADPPVIERSQEVLQELEKKYRSDLLELRVQSATDASSATSLWNRGISRTNTLEQEAIARINEVESTWSSAVGKTWAPRGWTGPRGPKATCEL